MSIKELLEALDSNFLLTEETYKQEELTPVIINPPKGKAQPMPPSKSGKQIDVEVINTGPPPKGQEPGEGEPQKGDGEGEPQKGDGDGKEREGESKGPAGSTKKKGKTPKPGEGKGKEKRPGTIDSHDILQKSDAGEAKEMAEKILEKSDHTRKERGEDTERQAGTGEGSFMDKLRGAHKPKINWVKELRKKLTEFKSQTSTAINRFSRKASQRYKEGEGVQKSKAYHQWLKDPRSHAPGGKILFKGPYVKAPIGEVILIVALDTSGSIPASTVGKVFAEMDKIAQGFKSGVSHGGVRLEGKVYFMTWDTKVAQVDEYKPGEWKQYAKEGTKKTIKGGGGTDPTSIFDYLKEHFLFEKEKPSAGLLNIIKKPRETGMTKDDIVIPIKDGESDPKAAIAPFLIIATDGYFFDQVNDSDLGILYKDNKENVLYLVIDGTTQHCYPKNIIEYESYRV